MKRFASILLLVPTPQAALPSAAQDARDAQELSTPAAEPLEPYGDSYAEGMTELERLAEAERYAEALALAESMLLPTARDRLRTRLERWSGGASEALLQPLEGPLGWIGLPTLGQARRAEVHYAIGTLATRAGQLERARESFDRARAQAGPGSTRLDAIYGLGLVELTTAEVLRSRIPELGGPQPPPDPAAAGAPAPDPLELARAAYRSAKEHFVERLRLDWSDADTRANVELCLRRLRELEEIERQREQQQRDDAPSEEQPSDSEETQDGDTQEDEPSEDSEEPEEQEPEEQEQPEGERDEESAGQEAPREPPQERLLTQEEIKRLLERMRELDEKGEELRQRLSGVRRVPVDKDW